MRQLYNVIDAVVAGRLVNDSALSAIGVSDPIYSIVVIITLSAVLLLGGKQILGLIIGNNEAMILRGYSYFKVCLWSYPVNAIIYGLGGGLSGTGDSFLLRMVCIKGNCYFVI